MSEPLDTVRDWLLQSLPGSPPVVIFSQTGRLDEPRPIPKPYTTLELASSRPLIGDLGIDTTKDIDPGDATKVLEKANVPYIGIVRATFYSAAAAEDVRKLNATRGAPANLALFESRRVQVGEPESILEFTEARSTSWDISVQVDYPVMFAVQDSYGVDFVDTYDVDTSGVTAP